MNWLTYVFAIAAGAVNPVQSGANAQLHKSLGQPLWSGVAVYVTGLASILSLLAFVREPLLGIDTVRGVPWWAWTGGVVSIASTLTALTLAQRLGSGIFTGLSITASIVTSVVIDHFGWLGFKQHPMSLWRGLGCGLMVSGLWLVSKF